MSPTLTRRHLFAGAAATVLGASTLSAGPVVARPWPPAAAGAGGPDELPGEPVVAWFRLLRALVRTTPGFTPPIAARAFAYAGVAAFEAVVAGSRSHRSMAGMLAELRRLPEPGRRLDWSAVANAALADIVRRLVPTDPPQADLINALEAKLAAQGRGSSFERSVAHGRAVAAAVFAWSRTDGGHEAFRRNSRSGPALSDGPGAWVPTPPKHLPPLLPAWGANRCFVLPSGAAYGPGTHPPFSTDPESEFHAQALEVYAAVNEASAEHQAIARFWSDDPGTTATPSGHSISIASQALEREHASLMLAAETFAKIGLAVSDAFVACWYAKYTANLLRPVTYIQQHIDGAWSPLLGTPPFPEYPSGHSVQSAAAARGPHRPVR